MGFSRYTAAMPEFLIWKLLAFAAVCFIVGVYRGITGQPEPGQRDKESPPDRDG